ncbi:MAG: dephospho-CoA kinase [Thermoleophilia bacterium]|nr:dephospho-CoA kinase [Thermoleophilia bacterium]
MGLTGGIGSGKSAALAAFARCGAAVLSADAVVHALYADREVRAAVRERFGPGVIGPGGEVDRAALGARAFAEEGGIRFLEDLLHPRVGAAREAWVAARRAEDPPPPLLVCEVPLLFEAGLADRFDAVLVVTASEAVRRARVEARGQRFAERVGRQWDEGAKVAAADCAFTNDGDLDALGTWVAGCFARHARRPCGGAPG